ncbi:hypothetical protein ACIQNU_32330 [Streptomyces sp. NPDC091292]|uniref:hypothetical protein n=1 Tax=Streptomyces sp. NPDC091292 TaxID=3365991 RepID=UPI003819157B
MRGCLHRLGTRRPAGRSGIHLVLVARKPGPLRETADRVEKAHDVAADVEVGTQHFARRLKRRGK